MSKPKTSKPTPEDDLETLALSRGGTVKRVAVPMVVKGKRPSKYRNVRCEHNGRKYDSKAEMAYGIELERRLAAGEIHDIQWQPRFTLGIAEAVYVADFLVFHRHGSPNPVEAVDVKGVKTRKFIFNVRLWRRFGPCPLLVVTKGKVTEVIEGKPRGIDLKTRESA
jgi:hypothetical protein